MTKNAIYKILYIWNDIGVKIYEDRGISFIWKKIKL